MELLQLRYFCTTAKLLNISHAAAFYSIPQPAMSKTISKLEDELGVRLFTRQKNHIFLTAQGSEFYERISEVLNELDSATESIKTSVKKAPAKKTRFNLMVSMLQTPTADFITKFHTEYPDILINTSKYPVVQTDEPYYDLCINTTRPSDVYDMSIPLASRKEELYLAVPQDNPFSALSKIRVKDMKDLPFVSVVPSYIIDPFTSICKRHGFEPNFVITCDDFQTLQKYILSGAGVAITITSSWKYLASDKLRFIKTDAKISQIISLYWSSKKASSPEWNLLFEKLVDYYK